MTKATLNTLAMAAMPLGLLSKNQAAAQDSAALYTADRIEVVRPFDREAFYKIFSHTRAVVEGASIHYVSGGSGPPVLLLHGWPGSWYYWRHVMPELALYHKVVAVDLPGFGDSSSLGSSEKAKVASALKLLMDSLGHERVSLASHDMGGTVAYAYAAQFPDAVDKVVLSETAIPGFGFADGSQEDLLKLSPASAQGIWHFAFFMRTGVPEMLIQGHERELLQAMAGESFTNPAAFTEDELNELTRWLRGPGGVAGGLNYYRSLFADAAINQTLAATKLNMPVLLLNGGDGFLQYAGPPSVRAVAEDVTEIIVPHSGHFIASERPGFVAQSMLQFLGSE